jgi:hypothetical protein
MTEEETTEETEGEEIYYEQPYLSRGIDGVAYDIVHVVEDDEVEVETWITRIS